MTQQPAFNIYLDGVLLDVSTVLYASEEHRRVDMLTFDTDMHGERHIRQLPNGAPVIQYLRGEVVMVPCDRTVN
jgi:hypothetical protein